MIIRVQHFVWGKLIGALNGLARSKVVSLTGVIQTQIVNFAFFWTQQGDAKFQVQVFLFMKYLVHTGFKMAVSLLCAVDKVPFYNFKFCNTSHVFQ